MKHSQPTNGAEQLGTSVAQLTNGVEQLTKAEKIVIINQTAMRIAIDPRAPSTDTSTLCGCLVIPPFGKRELDNDLYAHEAWERFGLVQVQKISAPPPLADSPPSSLNNSMRIAWILSIVLLGCASLLLALSVPLYINGYFLSGVIALVTAILLCIVQAIRLMRAAPSESLMGKLWLRIKRFGEVIQSYIRVAKRLPVVICISAVVPIFTILIAKQRAGAAYSDKGMLLKLWALFTDPLDLMAGLNNEPIMLFMRLWLIFVASILPALMLYLFHSQSFQTLRDNFYQDIIRLSPFTLTKADAETTHEATVGDILGRTPESINIVAQIPVLVSTFLFSMGWTLTLLVNQVDSNNEPLTPLRNALIFGFLGAYFFALNTIFRRYVRADLNTKAYTHMGLRILVTFVLVWVLNELLVAQGETTPQGLHARVLYIVAFFVGIVPETASAVLQDFLRGQSWVGRFIPALQEQHPLHKLNGITLYDQARLLEEGIENIEALAHHNLIELLLRTRIPAPRLIDLVDQAILYLHVRGPVNANIARSQLEASEDGLLYRLNTLGIRTATDLWLMYWHLPHQDLHSIGSGSQSTSASARSKWLSSQLDAKQEEQLRLVLHALEDDEWMAYLLHWRSMSRACLYTYRFQDFVDRFMKLPPPARWSDRRTATVPNAGDCPPPAPIPVPTSS
jgi:X-X-X-Leu-X-X-Gly heptad repeat protein